MHKPAKGPLKKMAPLPMLGLAPGMDYNALTSLLWGAAKRGKGVSPSNGPRRLRRLQRPAIWTPWTNHQELFHHGHILDRITIH